MTRIRAEMIDGVPDGALAKTGGNMTGPLGVTQLNLTASADLTILNDAITVTGSFHRISTEGGTSTDSLATINGGVEGMLLTLMGPASGGQAITLVGTGNISTPLNTVLTITRAVTLRYTGGFWRFVSMTTRREGELEHNSNSSANYNVSNAPENIIVTATLTADINIGLAKTASPAKGDRFFVDAQHSGAFNVVVRDNNGIGTILGTLGSGKWLMARYDGANWTRIRTGGSVATP